MSKPITRVVLSILISLAVLAGIYTTVYGAAGLAGTRSGHFQVTAGLLPDLSHTRMQAAAANASSFYTGLTEDKPRQFHDCSDGNSALDE